MTTTPDEYAERYLADLRAYLDRVPKTGIASAGRLGRELRDVGVEPLKLVQLHQQALSAILLPELKIANHDGILKRSGSFFRASLAPLLKAADAQHLSQVKALKRRLKRETDRHTAAEVSLKASRAQQREALAHAKLMQTQLRHLSHQILQAQEEERKNISRELHDEISQILTGINVRLSALTLEASANTGSLKKKIVKTQQLVEQSVATVHRFARELRPAMLDDLGLVPALLTFMKDLGKRTGLRIQFISVKSEQLNELDNLTRTVLYRVTQEALTNTVKHAHATRASVQIKLETGDICMEISDDGRGFDTALVLKAKRQKRLGIIGMRERICMVGGEFVIEAAPNGGTTIRVRMPLGASTSSADGQNFYPTQSSILPSSQSPNRRAP